MKNIINISKRGIATVLTLCILLGVAGTCVYAASAMSVENTVVTEGTTQELSPMMARGCSSLESYLGQYSSQYGYVVNDVKYGSDIPLSNGYYYHAGQYGGSLMCFIYDSNGNCVQSGKI